MYRHIRLSCKMVNTETNSLEKQLDKVSKQVEKLAAKLEEQQALMSATSTTVTTIVNNTQLVNNTNVVIVPWDSDSRIGISVDQIAAAFAQNPRLQEFTTMNDQQLFDPEVAPPYVTELLMDLVKLAHEDPSARNVYLNPKRADQALVHMANGRWEIVPLDEASMKILDGVAKNMHRVVITPAETKQLPPETQNSLAIAGLLYKEEPAEYAKRAKAPMTAHLANNERSLK
jgi:hypothetical protein